MHTHIYIYICAYTTARQDRIDDVIAWDPAALKLTVGAGMTVAALLREAAQRNASVMVGALPAFSGLTVGGVLSAGGHGTGDMTISTLVSVWRHVRQSRGIGDSQLSGQSHRQRPSLCYQGHDHQHACERQSIPGAGARERSSNKGAHLPRARAPLFPAPAPILRSSIALRLPLCISLLPPNPRRQADMVTEVTFVDGSGAVQKATNPSPEFNAVSAGLGLAGIVTEVTLRLTAPTNTKLITRYLASDADLAGDIPKMLQVGCGECVGLNSYVCSGVKRG